MRRLLLLLLPTLAPVFGACASHNAHLVRIDPVLDLEPLVGDAFAALRDDYGQPLARHSLAFAVDVDPVDVTWEVAEADGSTILLTREELRLRVEECLAEFLGEALVPAEGIAGSELRLNAWLLLDLRELDVVRLAVVCALTHRDRPERVLASGHSDPIALARLRCFGCRDDWGMERGTDLSPGAEGDGPRYYYGHGFWTGIWIDFGHSHSLYRKVR